MIDSSLILKGKHIFLIKAKIADSEECTPLAFSQIHVPGLEISKLDTDLDVTAQLEISIRTRMSIIRLLALTKLVYSSSDLTVLFILQKWPLGFSFRSK